MDTSCQDKKPQSSVFRSNKFSPSFTLIELLIVIAIIAILAGVVISVINPVTQRKKAQEGVLRANVAKICAARGACLSSSSTGLETSCDESTEIGIVSPNGTPATSTYTYDAGTSGWQGDFGACTFYCDPITNAVMLSGTCSVQ